LRYGAIRIDNLAGVRFGSPRGVRGTEALTRP
jgi:hypothetical protein